MAEGLAAKGLAMACISAGSGRYGLRAMLGMGLAERDSSNLGDVEGCRT